MKLKFIWEEEEEGTLSTKLKFIKPTQFGAQVEGGATLPEPVEVPSYWGISDLTKPKEVSPEQQQMESLSIEMKALPTRKEQESFAYEVLTGKKVDDIFTLPLEERKKALTLMTRLQRTAVTTTEKFNEVVSKIGWVGALGIMGTQVVAGLIRITPEIWRKLNVKIVDKKIPFKEGLDAILKTGHGEGTTYQRKIFNEAIKQADSQNISVVNMLKKGLTITEVTPRFAFGTKLYGALPADEMVKLITTAGKVTKEMVRGLDPAKITQVAALLEPALATAFLKATEKVEVPEGYIRGYHYTDPKNVPAILKEGLIAGKSGEKIGDVLFTKTPPKGIDRRSYIVVDIPLDLEGLQVSKDPLGWIYATHGKVPAKYIKGVIEGETGKFITKPPEEVKVEDKEPWEPMALPTPEVPGREYDFREPKIKMYYTPKKQLLREIGAEPILKDLIEKKESLMVEAPKVNKWIGDVIKEINKKATFAEKLKAKTFNLPTEQVARFRDLLNTYEKSPDFLDPKTKEIFDKLRNFTKGMLDNANEMRVKAGLYPITDFGAYVPHFLDEISRAVRLDPEARKKVEHIIGKRLPKGGNPTALQRQISAELDHIFSKDLGKLLMTMAKYDLRDIYLSEPYSIVRAELKQLIKDKAIPQSVLTEVENYIKFDVFDYQVPVDRVINVTLKPGTDILNSFLKPFNRIITNPIQNISSIYRQLLMGGAVAGKVRMLPRNLMQRMLNITLYPVTDSIRAQFSAPEDVVEKIRATNIYQLSIRKFEDVPDTFKIVQVGMAPYAKTHAGFTYFSNVDVSARVGWNYGERMIAFTNTPKGKVYIDSYAKKRGIEKDSQKYKDLFWREGDQLEEAKEAISKTQWEYYPTGMPRVYRGHMARMMWSLNSWWMNYFGAHAPEMFSRSSGRTGRGRIVRKIDRTNALKGLAIILGISAAIKEKTGIDPAKFLVFPFPSYIYPHLFQIMVNTYGALTAKNQKEMDTHQNKLKNNFKMLIPYSGAWRRYVQFLRGELTWKEWMFYVEEETKKAEIPLKITTPKSTKLKFTKPKLKSNKLKFNF